MMKNKNTIRKQWVLTIALVVVAMLIAACQKPDIVLDKEHKTGSGMQDDKTIMGGIIDSGSSSGITLTGSKVSQGVTTGECAADMYRPEGYHTLIGSALALKLSLYEDSPEKVYDVVIPCLHRLGEEGGCKVERLGGRLDRSSWKRWARIMWPDGGIEEKYHAQLTRGQIDLVAESGLWCLYLGSGKGDIAAMSFENPRGIEAYCELVGDMYTFASDGSIIHRPDLVAEGLIGLDS